MANASANNGVILRLMNHTSVTLYRLSSKEYWIPGARLGLKVTYLTP